MLIQGTKTLRILGVLEWEARNRNAKAKDNYINKAKDQSVMKPYRMEEMFR